jgi:hypothetical protein
LSHLEAKLSPKQFFFLIETKLSPKLVFFNSEANLSPKLVFFCLEAKLSPKLVFFHLEAKLSPLTCWCTCTFLTETKSPRMLISHNRHSLCVCAYRNRQETPWNRVLVTMVVAYLVRISPPVMNSKFHCRLTQPVSGTGPESTQPHTRFVQNKIVYYPPPPHAKVSQIVSSLRVYRQKYCLRMSSSQIFHQIRKKNDPGFDIQWKYVHVYCSRLYVKFFPAQYIQECQEVSFNIFLGEWV